MAALEDGMRTRLSNDEQKNGSAIERPVRYRYLYGASLGQVANGRAVEASSNGVVARGGE